MTPPSPHLWAECPSGPTLSTTGARAESPSQGLFASRMPHKCHGNGGNCPSRSHPAIWELPINELDRRDDPDFDEILTGCHLVSSCSNIYNKEQFRRLLQHNFDRHYNSNKVEFVCQ